MPEMRDVTYNFLRSLGILFLRSIWRAFEIPIKSGLKNLSKWSQKVGGVGVLIQRTKFSKSSRKIFKGFSKIVKVVSKSGWRGWSDRAENHMSRSGR